MKKTKGNLVLGLETGLDGGTLSVLEEGEPIDHAFGRAEISKSEDLLGLLEWLLEKSGIEKEDLGTVVVSDVPGSITGIRIGLALAKGLGDALGIKVIVVSILEAMAKAARRDGDLVVALWTEKSGIFFRRFKVFEGRLTAVGEIINKREVSEFIDVMDELNDEEVCLVMDEELRKNLFDWQVSGQIFGNLKIEVINGKFAEILGKFADWEKSASDNG